MKTSHSAAAKAAASPLVARKMNKKGVVSKAISKMKNKGQL